MVNWFDCQSADWSMVDKLTQKNLHFISFIIWRKYFRLFFYFLLYFLQCPSSVLKCMVFELFSSANSSINFSNRSSTSSSYFMNWFETLRRFSINNEHEIQYLRHILLKYVLRVASSRLNRGHKNCKKFKGFHGSKSCEIGEFVTEKLVLSNWVIVTIS